LRKQSRWSAAELARASGLAPQLVSKIEKGATKSPSIGTIFALADAFGLSIEELLQGGSADRTYRKLGRVLSDVPIKPRDQGPYRRLVFRPDLTWTERSEFVYRDGHPDFFSLVVTGAGHFAASAEEIDVSFDQAQPVTISIREG